MEERENEQLEESPPKSSAKGYFKGAAWCAILGLMMFSMSGGLISLCEKEVGILLLFISAILVLVGLVKAIGIDD